MDAQTNRMKLRNVQLLCSTKHSKIYVADTPTNGRIVLKECVDDSSLLREIEVLRSVSHPHIVEYFGTVVANSSRYLLLQYCGDGTLLDHFNALYKTKFAWTMQIASALSYLCDNGIIHRDIKPENILINDNQAYLIDFNCAVSGTDLISGRIGTPEYMAPEVFYNRSYSFKADVFSFGVLIFELFARRRLIKSQNFYDKLQDNVATQIVRAPRALRKLLCSMICVVTQRINMKEVVTELQIIATDMSHSEHCIE